MALCLRLVAEAPLRHHHLQRVADLQHAVDEAGEAPLVNRLYADLQQAFLRRTADGVATPQLFAVDQRLERQVLAGV